MVWANLFGVIKRLKDRLIRVLLQPTDITNDRRTAYDMLL